MSTGLHTARVSVGVVSGSCRMRHSLDVEVVARARHTLTTGWGDASVTYRSRRKKGPIVLLSFRRKENRNLISQKNHKIISMGVRSTQIKVDIGLLFILIRISQKC